MLGHDMRTPLQAIQMTASYLAALNAGANVSEAAARLISSGARMHALLNDLVDFNRTKLAWVSTSLQVLLTWATYLLMKWISYAPQIHTIRSR